jgi:hypothetical protein
MWDMHTTIVDMMMTHLETLANQLAHSLPWVKALNEDDRASLLADLAQACVQVRQTGQSQALIEVLEDWEATVQALGDKHLMDRLLAPTTTHDCTPWEAIRADISGTTAS